MGISFEIEAANAAFFFVEVVNLAMEGFQMAKNSIVREIIRYNPMTHERVKVGTAKATAILDTLSKFDMMTCLLFLNHS